MSKVTAGWVDDHSFEVHVDGTVSRVSVTSDAPLLHTGDALLALCLPIAMVTGTPLVIEDEVDERLMRSQARVQEILIFRLAHLNRVTVDAPTVRHHRRSNISSFFSGGVDSTYTVLQHRSELTQLVFVHGFDTRADQPGLRAEISQRLGGAADSLGIPLIEISTNLRDLSDRFLGWYDYHGPALAGIAHTLDTGVSLHPAAHTYADGFATSMRPLVDPLWSSGAVQIEHDGANASRTGKIAAIVADQRALAWLRVCYKNPDQAYNCGRCEKCLRTMLPLQAFGALEQAATFPNNIEPQAVRRLRFHNRGSLAFAKENLQTLEGPLRRALRTAYRVSVGERTTALMLDRLLSSGPSWAKPPIRFARSKARALRAARTRS